MSSTSVVNAERLRDEDADILALALEEVAAFGTAAPLEPPLVPMDPVEFLTAPPRAARLDVDTRRELVEAFVESVKLWEPLVPSHFDVASPTEWAPGLASPSLALFPQNHLLLGMLLLTASSPSLATRDQLRPISFFVERGITRVSGRPFANPNTPVFLIPFVFICNVLF